MAKKKKGKLVKGKGRRARMDGMVRRKGRMVKRDAYNVVDLHGRSHNQCQPPMMKMFGWLSTKTGALEDPSYTFLS